MLFFENGIGVFVIFIKNQAARILSALLIIHCWDSGSYPLSSPCVVGLPSLTAPASDRPLLWNVLGSYHTFVHQIVTALPSEIGIAFSVERESFRIVVQDTDSSAIAHVPPKPGWA